MPKFTGKFEYLIDGKKVTQEHFQQLVDGRENDYDISIDNLRVVASGKEPFFLDEFLFPAKNYEEVKIYDIKIPVYGSISSTGGTVFEKVQDSTLDTYNAIVGHSIRHKVAKEIKPEDIWNDDKREAVSQAIQKDIRSQDTEQKQQVKNLSEKYKKEDLDYLKKQLLNSGLFLSLEDATLIYTADTKEQLKPLIERMENCKGVDENFGKKEVEGKLDYSEINLDILDLMAERFTANKHKYPKGNMLKQLDKKDLVWAGFRHIKKMLKPKKNDPETFEQHLTAVLCNMSMILDQLNLEDDKTN